MADAPLIWAGPMLRRVEPRLVTVWVALSKPCALKLTLFDGRKVVGTGPGVVTGELGQARAGATTLRVGAKLHVGVVVAELTEPLLPGRNYSYNLAFQNKAVPNAVPIDPDTIAPDADLRSLGLLADGTLHKALGYAPGELPGFALPPAELTNLRILHGSCRRPGFIYNGDDGKGSFDGLAFVDDLIVDWRRTLEANVRPHQLFLTGDQIYADDVATAMLPMLNRFGNELIGTVESLPLRFPPKADEASKEAYLGAPKQTGFATIQAFVDKQRADGKDPLTQLKLDPRVRAQADPCFDHRFRLLYDKPYTEPAVTGSWKADLANFPARLRESALMCETKFSTTDLENHLISLGEYCALYIDVWSNAGWEPLPTVDALYPPPSNPPQLWDLHGLFDGKTVARSDPAFAAEIKKIRDRAAEGGHARGVNTLKAFFDSLPRVRRALANVPTYMVFDDHDVTDDWNIGRAWRDQVYTTPLGRRIVTDALVAYALFQDWGNDPLRYRTGDYRKLLDEAAKLFPEGAATAPPPAVADGLAALFGLNQADPETPAPKLKWHFTVDGPRHRVFGLDTRTRREFRSRYLPAALLSTQALNEQLPDPAAKPLPPGVEAVVVISQTPVAMPSIAGSVIVP